jgi:hypothetical protein
MKYKVGDKVKLFRKEEDWAEDAIGAIDRLPNRVVTIKEIVSWDKSYRFKEIIWAWYDNDIECLAEKEHNTIPSVSRFDLMDFED